MATSIATNGGPRTPSTASMAPYNTLTIPTTHLERPSSSSATSPAASPVFGLHHQQHPAGGTGASSPLPSPLGHNMVTITATSPVSINDVRTPQSQHHHDARSSPSASPPPSPPSQRTPPGLLAPIITSTHSNIAMNSTPNHHGHHAAPHTHHHNHFHNAPHLRSGESGSGRPGSATNSRTGSPATSGVWLPSTSDNIFDPSNYQIHRNNRTSASSVSGQHSHSLSTGSMERSSYFSHLLASSDTGGEDKHSVAGGGSFNGNTVSGRYVPKKRGGDDDDDAFFISESPDPPARHLPPSAAAIAVAAVAAPKSEPGYHRGARSSPSTGPHTPLSRSRAGSGNDPHLPNGGGLANSSNTTTSGAAVAAMAMLAGGSSGALSPTHHAAARFGGTGGLSLPPSTSSSSLHVPMPIKAWHKQSHVPIIHRQGMTTPTLYFRVIRDAAGRTLFKMRLPAEEDTRYERLPTTRGASVAVTSPPPPQHQAIAATAAATSTDIARTGTPPPPSLGAASSAMISTVNAHMGPLSHAALLGLPTNSIHTGNGSNGSGSGSGGWPSTSVRIRSRNPSLDRMMLVDDAGAAAMVASSSSSRGTSPLTLAVPTSATISTSGYHPSSHSTPNSGHNSRSNSMSSPDLPSSLIAAAAAGVASSSPSPLLVDDEGFDSSDNNWLCCRKKSKEHKFRFSYDPSRLRKKNNPAYIGKMSRKLDDPNTFVLTLKDGVAVAEISIVKSKPHPRISLQLGNQYLNMFEQDTSGRSFHGLWYGAAAAAASNQPMMLALSLDSPASRSGIRTVLELAVHHRPSPAQMPRQISSLNLPSSSSFMPGSGPSLIHSASSPAAPSARPVTPAAPASSSSSSPPLTSSASSSSTTTSNGTSSSSTAAVGGSMASEGVYVLDIDYPLSILLSFAVVSCAFTYLSETHSPS